MVTIRLRRFGKRRAPTYRLVVSEKQKDTLGTYLEELGLYNPRSTPPTINLKADRIKHWLSQGATASGTVHNLLVAEKVIDAPKRKVGGNPHRGQPAPEAEATKVPATEAAPAPAADAAPAETEKAPAA